MSTKNPADLTPRELDALKLDALHEMIGSMPSKERKRYDEVLAQKKEALEAKRAGPFDVLSRSQAYT